MFKLAWMIGNFEKSVPMYETVDIKEVKLNPNNPSLITSMQAQLIKISQLKNNTGQVEGLPANPRLIKDERFDKLVKSIKDDPEMLGLREVIAYDNAGELVVIAGNMRLKACKELGIKEVPAKILPSETPVEKLKAYTIKDNVPFGENDWELLSNEWDTEQLTEWGLDIPCFNKIELDEEDLSDKIKSEFRIEIVCNNEDHQEKTYNKLIAEGYECRLLTL